MKPASGQRSLFSVFDGDRSKQAKEIGMERAADAKAGALELARRIAVELCISQGETDADAVGQVLLERHGIETLGPAAGSIFKGSQFVFTGRRRLSTRATNHSREIKIWILAK